jgi:hypothetical protein
MIQKVLIEFASSISTFCVIHQANSKNLPPIKQEKPQKQTNPSPKRRQNKKKITEKQSKNVK